MFPWNFFSSNKSNNDPFQYFNDNDFQQLLNQWIQQAFPSYLQSFANKEHETKQSASTIKESVFETHDDIFIRIPIQDEELLQNIKIYYSLNKCMISGLKQNDDPHTIILPATVKKKGAKAVYQNGVLEIKIPKSIDWQLSEIDVDRVD